MSTVGQTRLYNLGCVEGQQPKSGIYILAFGRPMYDSFYEGWGTQLFNNAFAHIDSIEIAVKQFAKGFWDCSGSWSGSIIVVPGTSNHGPWVHHAHGQLWALMVNDVAQYLLDQGYTSRINVAGGSDMEVDWSPAANARFWALGYDSVNQHVYYNFGDASACSFLFADNSLCDNPNNDWYQEDVWQVSWGIPPARVIPQIYRTDEVNAFQWQKISLWGYLAHSGQKILFSGALTNYGACQIVGCDPSIANPPAEGWRQLWVALAQDTRTKQMDLPNSTDITWKSDDY